MPALNFGGSLLLPLQLLGGYTFERLPFKDAVDERFSTQLKDQLPDFVTSNYETFVEFIKAYYEWMEEGGNPRAEGVRLETYSDIDETLDDFIQYFRDTYIKEFPFSLADGVNEKTLVKKVKDLYQAKGTKASFDLLFRLLYDTTVSVSYPKDRILKLSTSTFDDRQFVRIEPVMSITEAKDLENTTLIQRSTFNQEINATALIDSVEFKHEAGIDFLSLAVVDVSGNFNDTTTVEMTTAGTTVETYYANVFPTLSGLKIEAGGTGFEIGDRVDVFDSSGNRLLNARVKTTGPVGDIKQLSYRENYGIFRDNTGLSYSFTSFTGYGASFSPLSGEVLTDGPDEYGDASGRLSSNAFIQDNFFFQNYSYIVRVNKSLSAFANAVRKLIHPSGSLMFAEYINETSMTAASSITSDSQTFFFPTIGHYLPHTFGTTLDVRGFTYATAAGSTHYDFYPRGYNGLDGNTSGDNIKTVSAAAGINGASFSPYYIPHVFVTSNLEQTHIDAGQSHDPNVFYWKRSVNNTAFQKYNINNLEGVAGNPNTTPDTGNSITSGALGSTAYIGVTIDDDGESVGLGGYFPVGSSRPNVRFFNTQPSKEAGCTHYGGYTSPQETSLSGGFSGGQIIQVVGTDSATADFWVVYRHPAHLGLTAVGPTGDRVIARIPMQVVKDDERVDTVNFTRDGLSYQQNVGFTLNTIPYSVGEIVIQEMRGEPQAIGRVLEFIPSAYHQGLGTPYYNVGIDTLVVEILNGKFKVGNPPADVNDDGTVGALDLFYVLGSFGLTGAGLSADINNDERVDASDLVQVLGEWGAGRRPVIGQSSGAIRLPDDSFNPDINITSVTYDTSWLDIPINVITDGIAYSNTTN